MGKWHFSGPIFQSKGKTKKRFKYLYIYTRKLKCRKVLFITLFFFKGNLFWWLNTVGGIQRAFICPDCSTCPLSSDFDSFFPHFHIKGYSRFLKFCKQQFIPLQPPPQLFWFLYIWSLYAMPIAEVPLIILKPSALKFKSLMLALLIDFVWHLGCSLKKGIH